MATMFEPSLSTSIMRAPLSSADAPSMADSLPNINFGFDELRERMARFTDRFDDFIVKGRKRVLEERNQFRINVAELQETERMKKQDLEILAQTSAQHNASLSAQAAETAEMQSAITSISQQRDSHATHRDNLRAEIKTLQKQISQRQSAQSQHAREMDAQSRLNVPELDFWETYLGMRIEGAGQADRLKFVFTCVDERQWEREAWFELDTEKREYGITAVRPKVEEGEVEAVLERLNESRDLGAFLKGMREVFMKAMK